MALNEEGATADLLQDQSAKIDEPISMDDTIRDTLRGLQEKAAPEGTVESPEDKAARIRDGQGKFVAKEGTPVVPEEVIPTEPTEPVSKAPNTWKKEGAAVWDTLPPAARAEIERREADFHKGIEQYRQSAQFAQTMDRAISPYANLIQSYGMSPDKAVSEMLQSVNILRNGQPHEKLNHFAQLAAHYGIDMSAVQQVQQEPVNPHLTALQQQVQQLTGYIQQQQSSVQQQAEQALNSEIASFAADPKHSHFEAVKPHMSALLQAGQAKDLEDAYEQAVFANPQTRTLMLQQQEAERRKEAAEKAQAARKAASTNVRVRPSMPVTAPIGTMEDTIREKLRQLQGA